MSKSFDGLWSAISDIGRSAATGGYRRYALTEEDHLLREWFAGEAAARLVLPVAPDRPGVAQEHGVERQGGREVAPARGAEREG